MELELGLPFPDKEGFKGLFKAKCLIIDKGCSTDHLGRLNNKRRHEQAATKIKQHSSGTSHSSLSLLLWAGQPKEDDEDDDDDDHKRKRKKPSRNTSMHFADDEKEENGDCAIIGWPPIKSWRMKMLQPDQAAQIVTNNIRRHDHVHLGQGS